MADKYKINEFSNARRKMRRDMIEVLAFVAVVAIVLICKAVFK